MEFRVERVAVVSSRHLTRETWDSGCGDFDIGAATFGSEYGFFCRVQPPDEVPLAPDDLRLVLAFFARHRIEWIRFDEAAPLVRELRIYAD